MATGAEQKFETVDISGISEFSGTLFAGNMIVILFGVPFALTSIGDLGTSEGSGWWSVFSILIGLSASLMWLVSGYNRTYWHLWLWFSLVAFAGGAIKIVSYLFEGDLLGFAGGVFIGVLPLGFLFMAMVGATVLLGSRIPAFDAKASEILRATGRLFQHEREVGAGGLPLVGRVIYLAGVLGAFSFPAALLLHSLGKLGILGGLEAADYLLATVVGFPVFGLMIFFGRRLMQPAAHATSAGTGDLPVLLLRAFADDERRIKRKTDFSTILFFGYRSNIRLEEAIGEELWQIGPFYGVGRPGETLPQLGASKAYFSDAEWQDGVTGWIDSSRLIVMIAGQSDWLKWELDQVIGKGAIGKLMILFPPDEDKKDQPRWTRIANWLRKTPFHSALKAANPDKVRALYFKPGGRVRAVVSNTSDQEDFELAIRFAAYDILKA